MSNANSNETCYGEHYGTKRPITDEIHDFLRELRWDDLKLLKLKRTLSIYALYYE